MRPKNASKRNAQARSSLARGSALCALLRPNGDILYVWPQHERVTKEQETSLLADGWHNDKPARDYTPCTLPKDADTARTKGYRVVRGTFKLNAEVRHARADATAAPSVEGPNKSRPGPGR